jgi:uncharacterized repeat protein (TIGR01451 family)
MRCSLRFSLLYLLMSIALALPAGAQTSADLQLEKSDSPDPVLPGDSITYEILLTNAGPDTAEFVTLEDTLPAEVTFLSLFADPSWTCSTPPVGSGGTVSCSIDSLPVGVADFFITVMVGSGVTPGTVITNTATASSETPDPDEGGPSASTDTTVAAPPPTSDVSVTKVDSPDPVLVGTNLVYTITVTNTGTIDAVSVNLTDSLPLETTFVSLSSPGGWMCTTPAVGTNGNVVCSIATFPPGSAVFTLTVTVDPGVAAGTQIVNSATVSATDDLDEGNNTGSATTTVTGSADLSVTKADAPDPVTAGTNLTYTITVTNAGPNNAAVSLSDTLPAGTTFVSLSAPGGWSCTTPAEGSGGMVSCSVASLGVESAVFTLTVAVDPGTPGGALLVNTATASSAASDPNPGDNSGSASTLVISSATLSGTKTVSGTFAPGGAVTYTVVLTNSGPGTQGDNPGNEFADVLPASLTLISALATSGTATATPATNTVAWNGSLAAGASVTITINAIIKVAVAPGTTISNQGTIAYDADGNGTNEASAVTDDPATTPQGDPTSFEVGAAPAVPEVPALDGLGLALLAALLSLSGAWVLRRRKA